MMVLLRRCSVTTCEAQYPEASQLRSVERKVSGRSSRDIGQSLDSFKIDLDFFPASYSSKQLIVFFVKLSRSNRCHSKTIPLRNQNNPMLQILKQTSEMCLHRFQVVLEA